MTTVTQDAPQITINDDDATPAFEQTRKQIVGHIVAGDLPIGTKLPPLRQWPAISRSRSAPPPTPTGSWSRPG